MLTQGEQSDLLDLTWHWDGAYRFEVLDGIWRARPWDRPADMLTAESARELREMVRQDYGERAARRAGREAAG